ncbi:hypothetical protein ACRS5S_26310 [Nocardia asiatica]|uniref:hypothetical protein n=1 Tax=Nocardia asiatica TaxID=209252 RepID=UPI003EE3B5EC
MSIREFAAHLGVHERLVSKWEAGGIRVHPRPINQAALDTSLARSDDVVRARFAALMISLWSIEPSRRNSTRVPMPRGACIIRATRTFWLS